MRWFILIPLVALFWGCSPKPNNKVMPSKDISEIQYHFQDSSVPPPYHRSYSIWVTSSEARVEVSDYNKVLAKSSAEISQEQWEKLQEWAAKISGDKRKYAEGASGQTGHLIEVQSESTKLASFGWDSLTEDKVKPDVLALREQIKACIPDLSKIIADTEN